MRFLLLDLLMNCINPFVANVHILYPLKTPENLRFSVGFLLFWGSIKWEFLPEMAHWWIDKYDKLE